MKDVEAIIQGLENTPLILRKLLDQIPKEIYRVRRVAGKWCIHEQVCHLAEAQGILIARFKQFENEENPLIQNYDPPADRPESYYMDLDMDSEFERYCQTRAETVDMLRGYPDEYWQRPGRHEGFEPYNSKLLLTHCLNVDYAHVFSIEQLGLTRPGLESGIMTLP